MKNLQKYVYCSAICNNHCAALKFSFVKQNTRLLDLSKKRQVSRHKIHATRADKASLLPVLIACWIIKGGCGIKQVCLKKTVSTTLNLVRVGSFAKKSNSLTLGLLCKQQDKTNADAEDKIDWMKGILLASARLLFYIIELTFEIKGKNLITIHLFPFFILFYKNQKNIELRLAVLNFLKTGWQTFSMQVVHVMNQCFLLKPEKRLA